MKEAKKTTGKKNTEGIQNRELRGEISLVIFLSLGFVFGVSMYTQKAGVMGRTIRNLTSGLLGIGAYLLPLLVIGYCAFLLFKKLEAYTTWKLWLIAGFLVMIAVHAHILDPNPEIPSQMSIIAYLRYCYEVGGWTNGGAIGGLLGNLLLKTLGLYGTYILIYAGFIVLFILFTGKSFIEMLQMILQKWMALWKEMQEKRAAIPKVDKEIRKQRKREKAETLQEPMEIQIHAPMLQEKEPKVQEKEIEVLDFSKKENQVTESKKKEEAVTKSEKKISVQKESAETLDELQVEVQKIEYAFPSINLLQKNVATVNAGSKSQMLASAKKLEETLGSFGVEAKVVQISRGPTVTRYELQPSQGVKVSRIVNLSDDIALNLAAAGIRIEAPIPGKAAVGIEVPNKETQPVFLREVLEDEAFTKFPSKVAVGLGKDIAGNTVVADIAKMPHILIAGATGSGKSVCINTLITSIIYKATPNEVKLLMVDPKVVELSVYNGIPHLMIPVVTDPKKAAGALNWAVQEMINRYKLFADHNVRDIRGYNLMKQEKGEEDTMPQIVIIIDELADLMMAAPGDVEDAICRLAQMARAAGLHLVIATQRPSVDVITGVIKANIPSRLAFAVSSGTDSRTILDMNGAEKLLGKGDMLFYPVGMQKPMRVQGAFISDKEVEAIVGFVKKGKETEYNEDMIEEITASGKLQNAEENADEYLPQAIELVVGKEKASVSMLQRYFRIGYNRAARLMEELQNRGVVGPDEGSKPRRVLLSQQEYETMKETDSNAKEA